MAGIQFTAGERSGFFTLVLAWSMRTPAIISRGQTCMQIEKITYQGWENSVRLSNGIADLVITTAVGPRIIRFGFVGEPNIFCEMPDQMGLTDGAQWRIYGGHRLWHAPESIPRTYYPDNQPVKVEISAGFVRTIQETEPTTGIQKEMDISLDAQAARVVVTHRLRNQGLWAVELAPWALSVMAPGGTAVIPLPPRQSHDENLLPVNRLVMWAYTDFSDPRWTFGKRWILLRQDAACSGPQKIGVSVPDGWAAYAVLGNLFVKQARYQAGACYPDMGSSIEVYTDAQITELETLGPLTRLEPGEAVEHVEHWSLFRDVPVPENDDDVLETVLPNILTLPELEP
jgi:hypothetical protein